VVDRVDRGRLLTRAMATMSVVLLILYGIVASGVEGAFSVLLLVSKQVKVIALLLFWVAIGDWLHGRQAKRLFAPLMAGLTLGTIAGSFASEPIGKTLGLDGILYFSAGIIAIAAFVTTRLRRARPSRLDQGLHPSEREAAHHRPDGEIISRGVRDLWRESGLFRLLLGIALASGILGPMLYFQFSYVADLSTQGSNGDQELLALYAKFRGWTYSGVLLLQLFVSARLYRSIGVPVSVGLFPLIYLFGFIGLSTQLSLRAGVAALSMAKLQGKAIYEPALRVLFNLMPDHLRARATALLEGPADRIGGVLGNLAVMGALALGSPIWVGYAAIPITLAWIAISLLLWRRYPNLLLSAAAVRRSYGDDTDALKLLDPATLRGLAAPIEDPDPERCRAAVELVCESDSQRALEVLATSLGRMPAANRPIVVAAIDRLLEARGANQRAHPAVAQAIEEVLANPEGLDESAHADLVQAWGRTAPEGAGTSTLEAQQGAGGAAVRLASLAAMHRRGAATREALESAIEEALASPDPAARRTAREELRAGLLANPIDDRWGERLSRLAELLGSAPDRADAAEAIADVAAARGEPTAAVSEAMAALRGTSETRIEVALLRYLGHSGSAESARWLADRLSSHRAEVAAAAREGLLALGPAVSDALLVEHAFGRRSAREAILEIVSELEVDRLTLESLYERELDWIRHSLLRVVALEDGDPDLAEARLAPVVIERLGERIEEGLHTLLLYLTAIQGESRIAQLDGQLRRARGTRRHAILLEALEVLLSGEQKKQLVPLLEDQPRHAKARALASELGLQQPSFRDASRALLEDPDELTRTLAVATWPPGLDERGDLARRAYIADHPGVLTPVDIALQLREIPIFARLSIRQLMDVVPLVKEESHTAGTTVCQKGEHGDCLYLIAEGEVEVNDQGRHLARLGPGGFFGEMALFNGVERSATVEAESDIRLLRLEREAMLSLMEEVPGIAVALCQALSARLREANLRID